MRMIIVVLALLLSVASAEAAKAAASGRPLMLYQVAGTNPDCSYTGAIVFRVIEAPLHGTVSIRPAEVFPNFPSSNIRSVCNARRVRGQEATYISRPGYKGADFVELQAIFPAGADQIIRIPIEVM
jgi:hypothetical protein